VHSVSVYAIEQHPENANSGDVDVIAESIDVNGFYQPIIVQASTKFILAGNHRYLAAVRRGMTEVPVIWLDVTEKQAKRIMLADNRTAALGIMDEAGLADLLESVKATDEGLMGTGYTYEDYAHLVALINDPLSPEDFADGSESLDETPDEERKSAVHLKYELNPVASEDGKSYAVTLSKTSGRSISANDFNMLLKALGQDPMDQDELAQMGIPNWIRR
jgi:hypothetical protein